jgi:enamine deaminase RidA (YjgF/YER057c/UK114 family)
VTSAAATRIAGRLAELGLTLPAIPAPAGSYVPAVRVGTTVYTSGQLPFVDGALPATGKVGTGPGLVDPTDAAGYARVAALNALAAVASVAGGLENVARIVKLVGFVASDPGFTAQPAVVNGASDLLREILGDVGVHARSAVGVAVLPLNSPVEIELIAELV